MIFKKNSHVFAYAISLFFLFFSAFVQAQSKPDLNAVAGNAMEPVGILARVIYGICYVVGVGLFLGGISQYFDHRANPNGVPISRSITFMILGFVTFFLPFIGRLSGIPTE